ADAPDEARRELAAAEATLAPNFHLPHVLAIQAAANIDLYTGNAAAARRRLDDAWPQIDRIGALRIQHLRVELAVLRARVVVADRGDPKILQAIATDLIREGAPWATGLGHLVRAAALVTQRDDDAALVALHAAEEALAGAHMIGWLHVARLRRGQLEGSASRADAARDLLKDIGAVEPDKVATLLLPWPR